MAEAELARCRLKFSFTANEVMYRAHGEDAK